MLDKQQYHHECLRRRRAGWHVPADGMGRFLGLLRASGCFFDKRECEWLCPTQEVFEAVRELRLTLDTLAVPTPDGPPRQTPAATRPPSRVCGKCGYETPRHGPHVCGYGPDESIAYCRS